MVSPVVTTTCGVSVSCSSSCLRRLHPRRVRVDGKGESGTRTRTATRHGAMPRVSRRGDAQRSSCPSRRAGPTSPPGPARRYRSPPSAAGLVASFARVPRPFRPAGTQWRRTVRETVRSPPRPTECARRPAHLNQIGGRGHDANGHRDLGYGGCSRRGLQLGVAAASRCAAGAGGRRAGDAVALAGAGDCGVRRDRADVRDVGDPAAAERGRTRLGRRRVSGAGSQRRRRGGRATVS